MNFYTYFKQTSKWFYKTFASKSAYPDFGFFTSLSSYRNYLLRSAFGIPSLDVSHFQKACFKVIPIDLPKEIYTDLWNFLFGFSSVFVTDEHYLVKYKSLLVSELVAIMEHE